MLSPRSGFALAAAAALSLASSACVVRWTDEPLEDDGPSLFDDDDATSVSSGSGGDSSTGVGGDTTGVGGAGGGDATTGAGGFGGDPYCLDGQGTGETAEMCEELAIAPATAGMCDDGWEPLGYAACHRSFEIWEGGFAEELALCLATIPAEDACLEDPVLDCVENLYVDTCEITYIEDTCQSWAATCSEYGDSLDATECYADLTPFNDAGITELTDCMNEIDASCQERYDICFDEVAAVD